MERPVGNTTFLDWLPAGAFKRAGASLADLSGMRMRAPATLRSYVTTTVETAWSMPVARLTCEHVRLLTSQKAGLEWLSRPVAQFVHRYPAAEVVFYPGDLTMAAFRAFSRIAMLDAAAAALIQGADRSWMPEAPSFHKSLAREMETLIDSVRSTRLRKRRRSSGKLASSTTADGGET